MDRKDLLVSNGVAYALLKGTRTQVQLTARWSFLPREAVHNTLGSWGLIHVGEPCFWGKVMLGSILYLPSSLSS